MLKSAGQLLILLIALQHLFFLYLEMFSWEKLGKRVFKGALAKELFRPTKVMAANQGLYNGFLAAGLCWSLLIEDPSWSLYVSVFFLCCVSIAGIYGGFSISKKIFLVQAIPAIIALILIHL